MEKFANRGLVLPVVALVAVLDGANAQLFHVEQWDNQAWEFQVRWPGSDYPTLRDWGGVIRKVNEDRVVFGLIDPTVPVEARWRLTLPGSEPAAPWQMAVPHEFTDATAKFLVRIRRFRDFTSDPIIRASALVRHYPTTFDLEMPRRQVAVKGEEMLEVVGRSWSRGYGNLLREVGEFNSSNDVFEIVNSTLSQAALQQVPVASPGKNEFRGTSFVKVGKLSPEEIKKLMEDYADA